MKERDPSLGGEPWSGASAASGMPSRVQEALAHARADLPSEARLARIAAALPIVASAPHAASPSAPSVATPHAVASAPAVPAAVPATASTLSGALVGAALGVVVSGAAFLWPTQTSAPTRSNAPPAALATSANATRDPLVAFGAPASQPTPKGNARTDVQGSPRATARPAAAHQDPPSNEAPAASATVTAAEPVAEQAPPVVHESGGSLTPDAANAPNAPADAESEAHLLARAEDALASNPALALTLAEQHAARFARGTLGQEREVVAIQALVRLGRAGEAKARAARFLAANPRSAHRPRIEAIVGPWGDSTSHGRTGESSP